MNLDLIINELDLSKSVLDKDNLSILSKLPLDVREKIALKTGMMVLYLGDEVGLLKYAEEVAAIRALPVHRSISDLIVANVGAGGRIVNESFIAIDAFRENTSEFTGLDANFNSSAILSFLDDLPFKNETLDAIISLHSLEHVENPVTTILGWLNIIKPGGGIGIILPNYKYTWSARNDVSSFGHKWDPSPELIFNWYEKYWKDYCILEKFDTLPYKLSFDLVLRKPGVHQLFKNKIKLPLSGFELHSRGVFPNDIY